MADLTDRHRAYSLALRDKKLYPVLAIGSAGTGKTFGAVELAVEWLQSKRDVVVTRPNVTFADEMGFLPGTEREKMLPWIRPVLQCFRALGYGNSHIEGWEKHGHLTFLPLGTIQGMTFDNTLVIVDEVENMTFQQLKVMLARMGKWSKIVLCGDIAQVSPHFKGSGLAELIRMVKALNLPVHIIEFTHDDIVRSSQCRDWIVAFDKWEADHADR